MNATVETRATRIDFEHTIKEDDVIIDLWSDKPLSNSQLAVLEREAVQGPLDPKYVTQHTTFENVYVYVLSWNCHDAHLEAKLKQLVFNILHAS